MAKSDIRKAKQIIDEAIQYVTDGLPLEELGLTLLQKNVVRNRLALRSSRFGHNGVIRETPPFMMFGGGEMFPRNSAAERQAVRINREIRAASAGIAPLNFYPPAVIRKPVSFLPRYRFDYVGKRQKFVKVAATEETGLALYDPVFSQEQKERYGLTKRGPSRISLNSPDVNMAMALRSAKFAYGHKIADRNERFRRMMMDDYEGSIYDLMKGGLSRNQADQVYVKQNAKWLSVLAKNNPKIAKHIPAIAKTLGQVSKVPGLGIAAANPISASALLAGFGLSQMNESRKTVAAWESAESFLGHPSAELTLAMKQAGVGDEGGVIKQYGKMTSWLAELGTNPEAWKVMSDVMLASRGKVDMTGIHERSTPEDIAKLIVPQMQGLDFNEKLRTLNALSKIGINESVLKGFEIYTGYSEATAAQKWTGYKQRGEDFAKRMESDYPILSWLGPSWYKVPIVGDLMTAVDMFQDWLFGGSENAQKAEDAARSADKYDAGGFSQGNDVGETSTTSNKVSFHIGEVRVDANDAQALVDSLMREGGKFTERIRIADSFDSMWYA